MEKIIKLFSAILAELMLIIGAIFILVVTYKINIIAFYYILGIIFILSGLFIAKTR